MKIGLTFDLKTTYLQQGFSHEEVAEFDSEETIAGIESTLNELGYQTERIGNIVELTQALVSGKCWDLVFNIAEGYYGIGREAQVPALLDAFRIPYVFSDPMVLSLTLHKAMAKHVIRGNGIPTAAFVVVKNEKDLENINLEYPLFIKPVAEGTGKGISQKSLVTNRMDLELNAKELLDKFKQPVLVEEYLPGREFTVGITGTGNEAAPCGIMEVIVYGKIEEQVYSLQNKEEYESRVAYSIPEKSITEYCYDVALRSWNALECRDGGRVDLRLDKNGVPNFIEVNPLAGLNPIHSDLPILCKLNGISYKDLIGMIMQSALKRINNHP
ncbi:MAG: D-alanine--D-alanine ligase [Bacteroidales bacterium]|nr:D-alanine--D-alanine ligase [Bacteroidales bacterium]